MSRYVHVLLLTTYLAYLIFVRKSHPKVFNSENFPMYGMCIFCVYNTAVWVFWLCLYIKLD